MSKIGEKSIPFASTVTITIEGKQVNVKGKEGEMNFTLPKQITAESQDGTLSIKRLKEDKKSKSLHGLYRSIIANAVQGVEKPWEKRLEVVGTGYNVKLQGEDLVFKVGYSHQVTVKKVAGIAFKVEGNNKAIVVGFDKYLVGQIAHEIKLIRKPDVYKGKGIKYEGERLRIKPGKKAKASEG